MKILIVKVSALGDIIHALPVLAYLHSCSPTMTIDWLVEESFATPLEGHPLISKVCSINTKEWRRQGLLRVVKGFGKTIRRLRQKKYDVVLDLQGNSKSGFFTLFSGAPLRYGFDAHGAREWPNTLATNRKVGKKKELIHITEQNISIAAEAFPGGKTRLLQGPLQASPLCHEPVEKKLQNIDLGNGPVVICHYGTTWKTKLWAIDQWQELLQSLWQTRTITPLLTWGNEEELAAVQEIAAGCRHAVIWPRGSLGEFIALLERADLVVGGDTGPIHLAAALGTATVSYFRATDSRRNGPRGPEHICLQAAKTCSPCLQRTCPQDNECRHSILPAAMLQAINTLLDKQDS
ncbi:MAG: lipopolysaccharide heptosyltransferase I [Deltaproteobacteria bacterium]|nr:lipopolysaccharide heptosyltransferase I [Candidatus Anaeroferrophillus wilburensis]MBN2889048.1 lipopolysaccharide heptosyltransferase I [Deltaproteobacteria bacterium]